MLKWLLGDSGPEIPQLSPNIQAPEFPLFMSGADFERIKKFPLPRQYANMSFYFVSIFLFLLPLLLPRSVYSFNFHCYLC